MTRNYTTHLQAILLAIAYLAMNYCAFSFIEGGGSNRQIAVQAIVASILSAVYTAAHLKWIEKLRFMPFAIVFTFSFLFIVLVLFLIGLPHAKNSLQVIDMILENTGFVELITLILPSILSLLITLSLVKLKS